MTLEELGRQVYDLRKAMAGHIALGADDGAHDLPGIILGSYIPDPSWKKTWWALPHAGSQLNAIGVTGNAIGGTPDMIYASGVSKQNLLTGSTSGNSSYAYLGLICKETGNPDGTWYMQTGASIANVRIWCGFASSVTFGSADAPAAIQIAGARYSDAVNGNWHLYTSSTAATAAVDSGLAVATDTWYRIRVWSADEGAHWNMDVNGTTAISVSANIPASSNMYHFLRVDTRTNGGKSINWQWAKGIHG